MAEVKRILITGATAGIGRACVHVFHAEGWEVWCCGRREDRLGKLQSELQERIHTFPLDVRESHAVEGALSEVPTPHLLLNNAGLSRGFEPLWEGKLEDWNEMLDTNVKGLLHVSRAILPRMIENGGGQVIRYDRSPAGWHYSAISRNGYFGPQRLCCRSRFGRGL